MPPKATAVQTSAARTARKVRQDPNKVADSSSKDPPQKTRPTPTKLPRKPTQPAVTVSNRHSPTPEVIIPQKSVVDVNVDSGDEAEYEGSGGHNSRNGDNDTHGHGDGNGNDHGGDDDSPYSVGNEYGYDNQSEQGDTYVGSPDLIELNDHRIGYGQYLLHGT